MNGIFSYNASSSLPDRSELIATRDAMTSRGPDGSGEWWTECGRLGLGHRRLSIIDPAERSNQPMKSGSQRYVIVFNGEIYNYPELRRELERRGRTFITNSDTEVLLHLYELKGALMVHDLRGMFAFAIWDNEARSLFLARDPYGIKPLYTSNDGWTFRFASQVKALLHGGKVSRDPEPAGMVGFHMWGCVPEPFTLYRDIRSLPAGHTQYVDELGPREPRPYISIAQVFTDGAARPLPQSQINTSIRTAALDSVSAHMLADVDVGIFLSAGVGSGAILGLMRDAGQQNVRAITLAFEEQLGTAADEVPLAAEVANQYGADHFVRMVSKAEFQAELPAIFEAMDQPSVDGINTWFAAKAAREVGLKVAISGIGGDEILAGYQSFVQIPRLVKWLRPLTVLPGHRSIAKALAKGLGVTRHYPKSSSLLEYAGSYPGAYFLRRGLFMPDELKGTLDPELLSSGLQRLGVLEAVRQAMDPVPQSSNSKIAVLESCIYMRNQLLRDADWAGMGNSVEIRTPLVDIALAQTLSSATPTLSIGAGKAALAASPTRPLPKAVIERTKTGFVMPMKHWTQDGETQVASLGLTSRSWAKEVMAATECQTSSRVQ